MSISGGKHGGSLGCLVIAGAALVIVFKVVVPATWDFLRASWPTWGLLSSALVLLTLMRGKKNVFCRAANRVLVPVAIGLTILMVLELLFGLFKSFFDAGRVSEVENTILKIHFAIKSFGDGLGYWVPVVVSIVVVFLCFSVGNWKFSSGFIKIKDAFSFLSLVVLVMSSFTFFEKSAANVMLGWEEHENQRWYKMALADEQRSVARIVATRALYNPIQTMGDDSKRQFDQYFRSLNNICTAKHCFREKGEFGDYIPASEIAFKNVIDQKAEDDVAQLISVNKVETTGKAQSSGNESVWHDKALDDIVRMRSISGLHTLPRMRLSGNEEADVDLDISASPTERLLGRRASSQREREEQSDSIVRQRERAHVMHSREKYVKRKMVEAFASIIEAAVPDAEGVVGAYVSELVDDAAEWLVRPVVNRMYKGGYRPEEIQDLKLVERSFPSSLNEAFVHFHAAGTEPSETSRFGSSEAVEQVFDTEQKSEEGLQRSMKEWRKEMEELRKEKEVEEVE
jgi:hypothetical protein